MKNMGHWLYITQFPTCMRVYVCCQLVAYLGGKGVFCKIRMQLSSIVFPISKLVSRTWGKFAAKNTTKIFRCCKNAQLHSFVFTMCKVPTVEESFTWISYFSLWVTFPHWYFIVHCRTREHGCTAGRIARQGSKAEGFAVIA